MITEYGNYRPSKHPVRFSLHNDVLEQPTGDQPMLFLNNYHKSVVVGPHTVDWKIIVDWPASPQNCLSFC